jgi:thioredoxin reductase
VTGIERTHIAILGAGPIGLEAALYAATLGLSFQIYERGEVAEHLQQWGHVRMFSPFGASSTPLGRAALRQEQPRRDLPGAQDLLTGREYRAVYLEPLALLPALCDSLHLQTTVVQVGRKGCSKDDGLALARRAQQPFWLLLRDAKGRERCAEADVVLDCTGVYGQPRCLGEGGIPAAGEESARGHIAWGLDDILGERREHYGDRTTLVVGAGMSAATTVCQLATLAERHPATWVIWLARRPGTQPIRRLVNDPARERDALATRANRLATRGDGGVEFHPQTTVHTIEWRPSEGIFRVGACAAGAQRTWEVDRVIANVGYRPDLSLCRELQVRTCPRYETFSDSEGAGCSPVNPGTAEPGYFVLGARSNGRHGNFLLTQGFEQVRLAFARITGKADLDLHRKH